MTLQISPFVSNILIFDWFHAGTQYTPVWSSSPVADLISGYQHSYFFVREGYVLTNFNKSSVNMVTHITVFFLSFSLGVIHELVFKSRGTPYEMILFSGSPDADITYGYECSYFCKRKISIHKFQQITCRDDYTFNLLFFPSVVINELILKSKETTNVRAINLKGKKKGCKIG